MDVVFDEQEEKIPEPLKRRGKNKIARFPGNFSL
jgi:hypothetical protein